MSLFQFDIVGYLMGNILVEKQCLGNTFNKDVKSGEYYTVKKKNS